MIDEGERTQFTAYSADPEPHGPGLLLERELGEPGEASLSAAFSMASALVPASRFLP